MATLLTYSAGSGLGVFTRGSVATEIDGNGVLATANVNVLRTAHYVAGERTVLIERALTNPIPQPEDFSSYTFNASSFTPAATVGPDGHSEAGKLVESSSLGTHFARVPNGSGLTPTAGSWVVASVFVKAAERTQVAIDLATTDGVWGGGQAAPQCFADLTTGVASGNGTFREVVPLADGWYRVAVGAQLVNSVEVTPRIFVRDQNLNNYQGDGTSGIYVWGLQAELGVHRPSSYAGLGMVRLADTLYLPFASEPASATYYVRFVETGNRLGLNVPILFLGAAGGSGQALSITGNDGYYRAGITNGTTTQYSSLAGETAPSDGQSVELRLVHDLSTNRIQIFQSIAGGAEIPGNLSSALPMPGNWGADRLYLGSRGGTAQGSLALRNVKIAEGAVSIAGMRAIVDINFQVARPVADVSNSGWTQSTGANLFGTLDEETALDTDYIESSVGSATDVYVCRLSEFAEVTTGPNGSVIRYRAGKVDGDGQYSVDGADIELEIELLTPSGASLSPPLAVSHLLGVLTTYELPIPGGIVLSGQHRVRITKRAVV